MAAIDFPASPTNGQVYAGWVYDSSLPGWRNVNSDSGVAALSSMGLKSIAPTSVVVGSGSATVNSNGTVTYSGASSISLNGLFTSAYANYRIVFQHILSTDTGLNLRLRAAGADNSSAVYNNHHVYWGPGGNGVNIIANHTVFGSIFGHGKQRGAYEINAPQIALRTGLTFFGVAENAAGSTEQHTSSAMHKADTQFDGVTIYPTSGTFTGTVTVYGYNN